MSERELLTGTPATPRNEPLARSLSRVDPVAPTGSDLEAGFFEVQLAQDPVHRLVREVAVGAEAEQGFALAGEDYLDHLLVGDRAVLVAVVVDLAGAGGQAPLSVLVEGAHSLDRLVAGPFLGAQCVDLVDRGLRRDQAGSQLLVRVRAAVVDAPAATGPAPPA